MSDLLKVADFDELPPSTVDLDAAVRTGRARERRNRFVAMTAVAVVVLVAAAGVALAVDRRPAPRPIQPPAKEWRCTVTTVPSQRYLVDPTGDVVVSWSEHGPIRMQRGGGAPREITGLPGADAYPVRVSSAGVLVGESSDGRSGDQEQVVGWMYRDGQVTVLPAPAGAHRVQPWSVNARGDVVGVSQRPGPNDTIVVVNELVLWPAAAPGTFRLLTVPDGIDPVGAIRDDGTVVGTAIFPGNGGFDGVVWWPDGTVERMHRPGSNILGSTGDWMFGNFAAADGLKGFRYNVRSHEYVDLGTFEPAMALAGGRLVGRVPGPKGSTPAIWHDGVVEALPLPAPAKEGEVVEEVEVTAAGNRTIYAGARRPRDVALVWHC